MATLVFSTLGTALGGPVGGAIGSLVGRQVDAALFGSPGRQGPRLKELAVTTSSYGVPLPRHFGRVRTAGSIIWATDLVEHSEVMGGGKGAPSLTTYTYTANFAVALASRPILGLGRIWADGKLLRGAEGDLKVGGTLRLYTGDGDEQPDPLIAAAEGSTRAPACRGLAYVVFEDLDLAPYYNRIPGLSFEVVADEDFDLAALAGDVIEDIDAAVPLPGIIGFTAENALIDDLAILDQVVPLHADVAGTRIVIGRERHQTAVLPLSQPAAAVDDDEFAAATGFSRQRQPAPQAPPTVLRYLDPDRDYQPGVQRASGRAGPGEAGVIELPATLAAADARALIERTARRLDWSRDRVSWRTSELDTAIAPGALVALPGIGGQWRVREWEWRDAGIELGLERVLPAEAAAVPALSTDPGRINPPVDLRAPATRLAAFELPLASADAAVVAPRLFAAVSAGSSAWSGAALYADRGDGALTPIGPSGRARAIMGLAETALPPARTLGFDRGAEVIVALADPAFVLSPAGTRGLAQGANLALVGEEIVQFAGATPLGGGRWSLAVVLRGVGGTEAGASIHAAGEPFVLLTSPMVAIDAATLGTASDREVVAVGRADSEPVSSPVALSGLTLRPLAPVHPRIDRDTGGGLRLRWTRRARGAWAWSDGIDAPLVEELERYLVTLGPIEAPHLVWTVDAPTLEFDAAALAAMTAAWPGAALRVRQQGTHALSPALALHTLP